MPAAATADPAALDLRPAALLPTAARLLQLVATIAAGGAPGPDIVTTLQRHWLPDQPTAAPLLRATLILCADHELNVSAFTARCVASSGATLYGVVTAGLAALQGYKHGGVAEQVAALWREASDAGGVHRTLVSRLRRGEPLPGFGHQLYPAGDPRARCLLDLLRAHQPDAPALALADALAAGVAELTGERPTIDFALVALTAALGLPSSHALALFAIGRTVGWLGHALEQYATDQLIRPRARYVGPPPAGADHAH